MSTTFYRDLLMIQARWYINFALLMLKCRPQLFVQVQLLFQLVCKHISLKSVVLHSTCFTPSFHLSSSVLQLHCLRRTFLQIPCPIHAGPIYSIYFIFDSKSCWNYMLCWTLYLYCWRKCKMFLSNVIFNRSKWSEATWCMLKCISQKPLQSKRFGL